METAQKLHYPSIEKPWMQWYPEGLPGEEAADKKVYDFLYEHNKHRPDGVAIEYFGNRITVREMLENIRKTAAALVAVGVRENDIVTVCMPMQPETIYLFYALNMVGATPNNVDPRYTADGLHGFIEEVHSRFVVTVDIAYPKIREAIRGTETEKVLSISPVESVKPPKKTLYKLAKPDHNRYEANVLQWRQFLAGGENKVVREAAYDPNRAALIVHTGGTTGTPKGVMLGDKAINSIAVQFSSVPRKADETFLAIMPPFIAYGYCVGVHMPLNQECRVVVIPNMKENELGKLMRQYHPNHVTVTPLHFQNMMKDRRMKHEDLSYVHSAGAGGDSMSIPLEKEMNAWLKAHNLPFPINKGYGMTEVCASVSFCYGEQNKLGSCGFPMYMTNISAFEPGTERELPCGETGEICIAGPSLMLGYYDNPEETAQVLRRHSDGQYWVHTGDLGHIDEEGFLFIESRIKRVIIRRDGFKVFPFAIENVISQCPDVKECCVVGVDDVEHGRGKCPRAHVVLKNGADPAKTEKALRKLCEQQLADYVRPVEYRFEQSMPYTGLAKIDYRKLELMK